MSGLMLTFSEKVHAETSSFILIVAIVKWIKGIITMISDFNKAIGINPSEGAYYNREFPNLN